jgi:hypothetical protein
MERKHYINETTGESSRSARLAMRWFRAGYLVTVITYKNNRFVKMVTI